MHASNPARFRASYQAIANKVRITRFDNPQANYLDLLYRWLLSEKSGKWLLIIDNTDDINFLRPSHDRTGNKVYEFSVIRYLPQRARGAILFTSRNSQAAFAAVGQAEYVITIPVMTEIEAQKLIEKKIPNGRGDATHRISLAHQLDLLPLAISQAAAYIACSRRMTIKKYLDLIQQQRWYTRSDVDRGGCWPSTRSGSTKLYHTNIGSIFLADQVA